MFGTVIDTEADGLEPTKFYVLSWGTEFEDIQSTPDYGKMVEVLTTNPIIIMHNGARWDIPNLEKLLDFKLPKETLLVDSLAVSWYLEPKRPRHSLESYGEQYGVEKPKIDDWFNLDYSVYKHRCETDVKINLALWKDQYKHLKELYKTDEDIIRFLRYLAFKMDCARAQEEAGWKLDIDRCQRAIEKLEPLYEEKVVELRSAMPPVPIISTKQKPKNCFKSDGGLSVAGVKWRELLDSKGLPESHDEAVEVITGYEEPNPGSPTQIKSWLFGLGWKPRTFKANKKGVDVPQINRSKQDGGGVCESVLELVEKEPAIESLDNLFVIEHRLGILRGFLANVNPDGFVHARVMGFTNTLRFKHTEVVNLPKPDAPFGEDIRGCLIAPEGQELCGSDMSSLEDKIKQHYIWKHDPEYVKEMNIPGYDPHLDLALTAKKITKKQVDDYKAGVYEPWLKTLRGIWKNGNYACQYGAFPPKIAKTVGGTLEEGQQIFDAYWKRNHAIKKVAQLTKTKTVRGQNWLFNPVSNFWYSLRAEKDKFSTLVQGTGVFCFDTWLAFLRQQRPQLTAQFHDEFILCVKKGYREDCKELILEAIDDTNNALGLNVKLGCDVQFGEAYDQIH